MKTLKYSLFLIFGIFAANCAHAQFDKIKAYFKPEPFRARIYNETGHTIKISTPNWGWNAVTDEYSKGASNSNFELADRFDYGFNATIGDKISFVGVEKEENGHFFDPPTGEYTIQASDAPEKRKELKLLLTTGKTESLVNSNIYLIKALATTQD